jgi:hypothetical protein
VKADIYRSNLKVKFITKGAIEMPQANKTDSDEIVKTLPKGEAHLVDIFKGHENNFNVLISATSGAGKGLFMDAESFAIEKKFYEHSQLRGQK